MEMEKTSWEGVTVHEGENLVPGTSHLHTGP